MRNRRTGRKHYPLPDMRTPGHPMAPLNIKMPTRTIASLEAQAARLHCNRGALARSLIVQGLEALEKTSSPQEAV